MARLVRTLAAWAVPAMFALLAIPASAHAASTIGEAIAHPAVRLALIALYFALRTSVGIAFAIFTCGRRQPSRPSREPLAWIACAVAMLSVVPYGGPTHGAAIGLILAGDVVAVASVAWLLLSVLALGRCFGVLPEARGLVTHGPYRLVRHPVYLGELGALVGLALGAPSVWNVAPLIAFAAAQGVRMRMEEAALTAAFPEYARYAAQTGRLLPGLRSRRAGFAPRELAGLSADVSPARATRPELAV
jgi:protein-S-isoprenylcysteine O-methyltransferase Ste14